MKKLFQILGFLFASFIIYGGVNHFLKPDFYLPFVPDFLPYARPIVYVSGIFEIVFGAAYFIPQFRTTGAWGILLLMLAFLPLHIMDVLIDAPAIGSKTAAYVRLPVQLLFIALSWKMKEMAKSDT
jgi:uncharacterized membrane protein